jgi:ribose transport system substrate-binding protein
MKPATIVLIIAVLVLFLLSTAMSIRYLADMAAVAPAQAGPARLAADHPDWRAIVLLPDSRDPFFIRLSSALRTAARDQRLALEFRPLPYTRDRQTALRSLELAVLAHPDGLIIAGSVDSEYVRLINLAVDRHIPVITVASDSPASRRATFVGTNGYSLGNEASKLIASLSPPGSRIGVILSQSDPAAPESGDQSILAGLVQGLKASGGRRVTETRSSRPGVASGEEIAAELLSQHPEISVLFCTTAKDTLAAAQILVDQNRVGQVTIVGVDNPPEVLDYLEKGIIAGTIIRNPENLGRLAVQSLAELRNTGYSSGFVDPGLAVVTWSTLHGR